MKKLLIFSLLALGLIGAFGVYQAKADEEPVCLPGEELIEGVCTPINTSSTPIWLIEAGYCKVGQVEYTDWSACDKRFGKNGFQWRNIVRPTANGCVPSTYDQVNTVRECLE